jgi:hypothetical protein
MQLTVGMIYNSVRIGSVSCKPKIEIWLIHDSKIINFFWEYHAMVISYFQEIQIKWL